MKLIKKLAQPRDFSNNIGHSPILSLSTGPGDCVLALGEPGDEVVTKKRNIARDGLARVWTTNPVSVGVGCQLGCGGGSQEQSHVQSTTNVPEDALQSDEVRLPRIMHVEANLLNSVGNIWSGEGQILEHKQGS